METDGIDIFLGKCDLLKETEFHEQVVNPYLVAIKAQYVEYTHGPNERGKDFLYVVMSPYGSPEFHACVVKNGRFNGRANDSNSVQTSLNQIQTSRTTAEINPVTKNSECPRGICFIATQEFPTSAAGNLGPAVAEAKKYCTFLMGREFATAFQAACPALFNEIVKPGAAIGDKLAESVARHREAVIFKLPNEAATRIFVEMRLLSNSKEVNRYAVEGLRPKSLRAEHIPKSLVHYVDLFSDSLSPFLSLPKVLEYEADRVGGFAVENTSEMEKIAVKFVNLDLFFDFASELYAGKAVVNSASKADCFFATSALLSLLLEQLGDRRYTTKVENASIGLVGGALDAIDELVAGTDCLFITGDPGGGKTFSAQEIALSPHYSP
ncbi:hypothetical protein, partial [Rhodopirellula europaea]|uniref:hypothetical protein n=1 Tax=Rhodopirellula europaea TaxID=1263866 RepID=UPI00056C9A1D